MAIYTQEQVAPGTPSTGVVAIYAKSDGFVYGKDDAGIETALSNTGGGTVTSVSSANADITVATGTTTPVLTAVQTPALRSATTTVNVSAATAPTIGQVLTATGASAATWQTPTGVNPNVLINAGFTVNQRAYASSTTLAAGSYGHDRWKAGASGGDYSFTQLASTTQITIAASKSLIQVVAAEEVSATSFVLSWTGTAQARFSVNSATPAGAYAASPILITGQTVGTTMSVEFNTGTLSNVKLEGGNVATSYQQSPQSIELNKCLLYAEALTSVAGLQMCPTLADNTTQAVGTLTFSKKRAIPTITFSAAATFAVRSKGGAVPVATSISSTTTSPDSANVIILVASGLVAGEAGALRAVGTTTFILISAEL